MCPPLITTPLRGCDDVTKAAALEATAENGRTAAGLGEDEGMWRENERNDEPPAAAVLKLPNPEGAAAAEENIPVETGADTGRGLRMDAAESGVCGCCRGTELSSI
jgi:hypothetical protein